MKQFVKPGPKVVVKPTIGWDKVPELAGNTNPKLVAEKMCIRDRFVRYKTYIVYGTH